MAVDLQTFYDQETKFLDFHDEEGSRLAPGGVLEDSADTRDRAWLFRDIPNSVGWPTETDGYSLDYTEEGHPHLLLDGEFVAGVWDAGRWFTGDEVAASTTAIIESYPPQLRHLFDRALAGEVNT